MLRHTNATNIPATSQKAKNGRPNTIGFTVFTKGIIRIVQTKGTRVKINFKAFIPHTPLIFYSKSFIAELIKTLRPTIRASSSMSK